MHGTPGLVNQREEWGGNGLGGVGGHTHIHFEGGLAVGKAVD